MFQETEDAKKAYIALNGHNFHGRSLEVRTVRGWLRPQVKS
jgi:hypothetical protein